MSGKRRRRRIARKRLKAHDRNQKFNKAYNDELRRRANGGRWNQV